MTDIERQVRDMSDGRITAARRPAERMLLRAVSADVRRAIPGSVRLDGYALDWTERTRTGPVARCAFVDGLSLLELVSRDLDSAS